MLYIPEFRFGRHFRIYKVPDNMVVVSGGQSSRARMGILFLTRRLIDPGFEGNAITLEISKSNHPSGGQFIQTCIFAKQPYILCPLQAEVPYNLRKKSLYLKQKNLPGGCTEPKNTNITL